MQPDPGETTQLLDAMFDLLRDYIVLGEEEARTVALWVAHTWTLEAAEVTPYLNISSTEKRSGKTTLGEVLEQLVAQPWKTDRTSAAALVRMLDKNRPTLILDESDASFGGDKDYAEALRGILNSGYRPGGRVHLCVGPTHEIRGFSVFGAKAIIGIDGKLPDTVRDRSIPIKLRRKAPGENVRRYDRREVEARTDGIHQWLTTWSASAVEALTDLRIPFPREQADELAAAMGDRAFDSWEPLCAIGKLAGPAWFEYARTSALRLSGSSDVDADSHGVRLLADTKAVFTELGEPEQVSTAQLLAVLKQMEEAPWGEWDRGGGLSPRKLARMLAGYDVKPKKLRDGDATFRGYERSAFLDPWRRYLPPGNDDSKRNTRNIGSTMPKNPEIESGTETEAFHLENSKFSLNHAVVPHVPLKPPSAGTVAGKAYATDC